jgi:hypothetical protein
MCPKYHHAIGFVGSCISDAIELTLKKSLSKGKASHARASPGAITAQEGDHLTFSSKQPRPIVIYLQLKTMLRAGDAQKKIWWECAH